MGSLCSGYLPVFFCSESFKRCAKPLHSRPAQHPIQLHRTGEHQQPWHDCGGVVNLATWLEVIWGLRL
jgi:hypothetical protein